jgi:hypothetical protein
METGTTLNLSEFERKTLAYFLFILLSEAVTDDDDNDEDIIIYINDTFSRDELAALRRIRTEITRA